MKTKIGVISDLHLFNKTANIRSALSILRDVDFLFVVGDIADRADEKQYEIFLSLIGEKHPGVPVYCVSGNHDNPARDDTSYRRFESKINSEYPSVVDACGAFYKRLHEQIDLIGLNPLYHQKQFFFPNKGLQIDFLQKCLDRSSCPYHIVMCHPPLIAHNPQRTAGMAPYIVAEQDTRMQRILDDNTHVIFLSGHTHVAPSVEWDESHGNLYINDGSLCPTTVKDENGQTQPGNVTLLEISDAGVAVTVKELHSEKMLIEEQIVVS